MYVPLPRLFVPLGLGVLVCLRTDQMVPPYVIILIIITLVIIYQLLTRIVSAHYEKTWFYGFLINLLVFAGGFFLVQHHNQLLRKDHFQRFHQADGYLWIQLREPPAEKTNSWQLVADVLFFGNDTITEKVTGRLMLYVAKDSVVSSLRYGDCLVISNRYQSIRSPQNPNTFNYQQYLARKNIFHSVYVPSRQWMFTGENNGRSYMRFALFLRDHALHVFRERHLGEKDFAVVSALLLGYRESLDEDLRREFAGAGAMHILCVSGLHVGIIFLILKHVFSFLARVSGGRFIRTLLIMICIWLYAAITGFSPSVLRASVMFSFVAAGQSLLRPTNIYNTLAASAFVLVISNPFIITHIGFQLSYLAVISIVSLQPWLSRAIQVKQHIAGKAWSIITVSIAAQLATGPLALHYFNQFPNYFLLTNLVAIPLAGLIIYGSLITLCLSPVPFLGLYAGQILRLLVGALHQSVRLIEGLPYSTISNVYMSTPETIMVFAVLFFLFSYLMKGNRHFLIISFIILVPLMTSFSVRSVRNSHQRHFVVYNMNRATAIDFFSGKTTVHLACEQALSDPRQVAFNINGNRLRRGIRNKKTLLLCDSASTHHPQLGFFRKGNLVMFHQNTLLIVSDNETVNVLENLFDAESSGMADQATSSFYVDYLVICQNPQLDMPGVLRNLEPGMVIVDASNTGWNADRFTEACKEAGVRVWNVREKGAYQALAR